MLQVVSVPAGPVQGGRSQTMQPVADTSAIIDDATRHPAYQRRTDSASVALLMTQHLDLAQPRTDSEALRILRQAFPAAPLAARVAAMASRPR